MLNVWTPSTSGKRAVMFWMHGGGFSSYHEARLHRARVLVREYLDL